MSSKVDFVILWVDGNDPKWLNEKKKYEPNLKNDDNDAPHRYRDWDNLQYWFRAVEKNASWVNKIFFITWGHIPKWLNVNHPKIRIVRHDEYIPREYLPTFNSNTIELNLHRIEELSENFVLFNDDMFVMRKTDVQDFFRKNMPVEFYGERINSAKEANVIYNHNMLNNISILNKYFNKHKAYKSHIFKYINPKYGVKANFTTLLLAPFGYFSMIEDQHIPVAIKKNTLKEIWKKESCLLNECGKNRFRDLTDITQYLIRYFQLASGNFIPRCHNFGRVIELTNCNEELKKIKKQRYKTVCFNDTDAVTDFEKSKRSLTGYLDEMFPNKCSYEL